jgi:hypothetical protein
VAKSATSYYLSPGLCGWILFDNNQNFLQSFFQILDKKFTIKDLEKLYFFLEIEVHNTDHGFILTQIKYIYSILEVDDPHLYRSIIDALHYVTISRPNISFVVNQVLNLCISLLLFVGQLLDVFFIISKERLNMV